LLKGECELFGLDKQNGLAFVINSSVFGLVSVVGHPAMNAIENAVAGIHNQSLVLATPDNCRHVSQALPGWKSDSARIHLLADSSQLPAPDETVVRLLLPAELDTAALLPTDLKEELRNASRYSPIAAALVEGLPVSFCYAAAETESLWGISIDTLARYRNRGYAGLCVSHMVKLMSGRGKRPVWGAEESNIASIRLARKLGFEPVDQLVVFRSADRGGTDTTSLLLS
jgi:GNAT superfamily N-acetyltransferase